MIALSLCGPTASGKTALSLAVAEALGCEIISCDSMQIYKGMDIGTAKATVSEQARVPHHLIDLLSPLESYSAEAYRTDALKVAREIVERGNIPFFVGGTGLYIDTVMRGGAMEAPESDPKYRETVLASVGGDIDALWERLNSIDPESAEKIHKNNVKRVIRALEIYDTTGIPKSELDRRSRDLTPDISVGMMILDFHNRDLLYERIDRRVDAMMEEGLLDEARALYEAGLLGEGTTASQAIGYKELLSYIEGKSTLSEAVELLKLSSRRYAKRQLTWFRRETDAVRIFVDREGGGIRPTDELIAEAVGAARGLMEKLDRRN